MITKFTDVPNNTCYMEYIKDGDYFKVWSEELPNVVHTFDCEEVESYLDRGIWKRVEL